MVWVSSKQMEQTGDASEFFFAEDLELTGARLEDLRGTKAGSRGTSDAPLVTPASLFTALGLSIYFSINFSLFHSMNRSSKEAISGYVSVSG